MDIFTPEYFEKHVTTVVPIVNVDLLIKDKDGRILLSWRDDGMFKGWHVPGRIVRFKETLMETISECYKSEIHLICSELNAESKLNFLEFFETIKEQDRRGHFITFLYENKLGCEVRVENFLTTYPKNGFLKWFNKCPEDLIPEQDRYRKYFK